MASIVIYSDATLSQVMTGQH